MNLEKLINTIKKITVLPPIPTLIISILSYSLVSYVLLFGNVNDWARYFSYGVSTYALIITLTLAFRLIVEAKGLMEQAKDKISQHFLVQQLLNVPFINKYVKDYKFRSNIALQIGFVTNVLFVITKIVFGVYYDSAWFTTIAVYYAILATMRFFLIHYVWKSEANEDVETNGWRNYRLCGIVLLSINLALSAIIILAISENNSFQYPGILIYIIAGYDLYAVVISVIDLIKYRQYGDPIVSATKVINFTVTLISILSLETAMIAEFGSEDDIMFKQIMLSLSGFVISVIVTGISVYMIVHATKMLKIQKNKN